MSSTKRQISHAALAACLDLTLLDDAGRGRTDLEDLLALCAVAARPGPGFGPVAAVCVWPRAVAPAASALRGSGVSVASVIAFPSGEEEPAARRDAIGYALSSGADEIDSVLDPGALDDLDRARDALASEREAVGSATWKVIIESGRLADAERIRAATRLVIDAGAEFVKTSTGRVQPGATTGATRVICEEIAAAQARVGVKLSGGIRTIGDAEALAGVVSDVLGPDAIEPGRLRLGASRLLEQLTHEPAG